VTNTDTIKVVGDSANQGLTLDLANGGFAPGKTAEVAPNASEIEMALSLGGGYNALTIQGSPTAADTVTLGSGGLSLNADSDSDATYSGISAVTINGNAGADMLSAGGSIATGEPYGKTTTTFNGGDGNDTITGSRGYDNLNGGNNDDTLNGRAGGDVIDGGPGNDTMNGDEDNDTLKAGPGNDTYNGGTGSDGFGSTSDPAAPDGADVYNGGAGTDSLFNLRTRLKPVRVSLDGVANDGEDTNLDGIAEEADNVKADVENVQLGHANDVFNASTAPGTVNRNITGFEGNDAITGSLAADYVDAGIGDDSVSGGAGADSLTGGDGNDTLNGEDDNDTLNGGNGLDTLNGGNDDDSLAGGNDNDTLHGNAGNDAVNGDVGVDQVFGDDGDDTAVQPATNDGADVLDGGTGWDTLNYSSRSVNQRITEDNVANDGADADANGAAEEGDNVKANWERITTGSGNDVISADSPAANAAALDNSFDGGVGNDTLSGGAGADYLSGYSGNDTIVGGVGEDQLYGGAGADTLNAKDGDYDLVDGGLDTDTATIDAGLDDMVNVP
jgi:Ca2+-binding RTX toxin-like protein